MQIALWIFLDVELFGQYALAPEVSRATWQTIQTKSAEQLLFVNVLIDAHRLLEDTPILPSPLVVARSCQSPAARDHNVGNSKWKSVENFKSAPNKKKVIHGYELCHTISYRTIRLAPSFQGCTWQFSQSSAVYTEYLRCQGETLLFGSEISLSTNQK